MNEKILKRQVDRENFYHIYLKTLNGHLGLTKKELSVLVEFCKAQASVSKRNISDEEISKYIFSTKVRQLVRENLNISPFNLNNIIKTLRKKKLLITNASRSYMINPRIFVLDNEDEYSINFKIQIV